jgi:hypothetical protein
MNANFYRLILAALLSCLMAPAFGQFGVNGLAFAENKGQFTYVDGSKCEMAKFKYVLTTSTFDIYLRNDGISYVFKKHLKDTSSSPLADSVSMYRLDMKLVGASTSPTIIASDTNDGVFNYYSSAKTGGITGVRYYRHIKYVNVYPNIDWVVYCLPNDTVGIKYDFIVRPGGDPRLITMQFLGATRIDTSATGDARVHTALGSILERKPESYQKRPLGQNVSVRSHFELAGATTLKFKVPTYDSRLELVIDPYLTWATFFGTFTARENQFGAESGELIRDCNSQNYSNQVYHKPLNYHFHSSVVDKANNLWVSGVNTTNHSAIPNASGGITFAPTHRSQLYFCKFDVNRKLTAMSLLTERIYFPEILGNNFNSQYSTVFSTDMAVGVNNHIWVTGYIHYPIFSINICEPSMRKNIVDSMFFTDPIRHPKMFTHFSRPEQYNGLTDYFLIKLNPDNTLAFNGLYGGEGNDATNSIEVFTHEDKEYIMVAGHTNSPNLNVMPSASLKDKIHKCPIDLTFSITPYVPCIEGNEIFANVHISNPSSPPFVNPFTLEDSPVLPTYLICTYLQIVCPDASLGLTRQDGFIAIFKGEDIHSVASCYTCVAPPPVYQTYFGGDNPDFFEDIALVPGTGGGPGTPNAQFWLLGATNSHKFDFIPPFKRDHSFTTAVNWGGDWTGVMSSVAPGKEHLLTNQSVPEPLAEFPCNFDYFLLKLTFNIDTDERLTPTQFFMYGGTGSEPSSECIEQCYVNYINQPDQCERIKDNLMKYKLRSSLEIADDGSVFLFGSTNSVRSGQNFPISTSSAKRKVSDIGASEYPQDGCIARFKEISSGGSTMIDMLYSSFWGGNGIDIITASQQSFSMPKKIWITGHTSSSNFQIYNKTRSSEFAIPLAPTITYKPGFAVNPNPRFAAFVASIDLSDYSNKYLTYYTGHQPHGITLSNNLSIAFASGREEIFWVGGADKEIPLFQPRSSGALIPFFSMIRATMRPQSLNTNCPLRYDYWGSLLPYIARIEEECTRGSYHALEPYEVDNSAYNTVRRPSFYNHDLSMTHSMTRDRYGYRYYVGAKLYADEPLKQQDNDTADDCLLYLKRDIDEMPCFTITEFRHRKESASDYYFDTCGKEHIVCPGASEASLYCSERFCFMNQVMYRYRQREINRCSDDECVFTDRCPE